MTQESKRKGVEDKAYDSINDEDLEIEDAAARPAKKAKTVKKVVPLTAAEVEDKCKKIDESQGKMEHKRIVLEARMASLKAQKLRADADLYKYRVLSA